jgi:putative copper resistance protein D
MTALPVDRSGRWVEEAGSWGVVRRLVPVLLCAVGVLLGLAAGRVGSAAAATGTALADPGELTRRLLPLSRGWFDLGAVGTIGALVAAGWLLGGSERDAAARARLLRGSARWSVFWCAGCLLSLLAGTSQVVGAPLPALARSPELLSYGLGLPQGRALLLLVVVSLSVACWAGTVRSAGEARVWALGALTSLAPLLATGHAATASNHLLAAESLLIHVLAVTVWVGGLLALVTHLRHHPELLRHAVPRFSRLALLCFVAVGLSGLVGAWTRIGVDPRAWASSYGVLLVLKTAAYLLLGGAGWLHRARSIRALQAGRPRAFARLAAVEVLVMGAVVGLAVTLSSTAPPVSAAVRAVPVHAATSPTVDETLTPVSTLALVTMVRPDALVLTGFVTVVVGYLAAVRGRDWPRRRRLAFGAGVLVVGWSLCGGLGSYSAALLSAQVAQLLTLALVAPVLLAAGLPSGPGAAEPVAGSARARGWLGRVWSPVNAAVLLVLLVAATFQTPLLELTVGSVAGHLALGVAALASGLFLLVPVFAQHRVRQAPDRRQLEAGLVLVAGVLVAYGWRMHGTATAYAGGWFRDLDWWWSDPVTDQRVAGVVMAGFGVLLLCLIGLARVSRRVGPGLAQG